MKFGMLMQFDPLDRSDHEKIEISKIQDGGGRHVEKSKSKIAIFRPVFCYYAHCSVMDL